MQNLESTYRKKILEAIIFFSQKRKIKNPSKMMIYKLLAEVDFRHFQETGMSVFDIDYEAFPKGPVPKSIHNEITSGKEIVLPKDFKDALLVVETEFEDEYGKKFSGFKFIAKRKHDLGLFTPREARILEEVADIYKTATATEASKSSHEPGKPWTITVKKSGQGSIIDLFDTIELNSPLTKEIARDYLKERKAMAYNYGG